MVYTRLDSDIDPRTKSQEANPEVNTEQDCGTNETEASICGQVTLDYSPHTAAASGVF